MTQSPLSSSVVVREGVWMRQREAERQQVLAVRAAGGGWGGGGSTQVLPSPLFIERALRKFLSPYTFNSILSHARQVLPCFR